MPGKDFAGPGRSFPISDANYARLAISGATRSEHAGNISPAEEAKIKAAARAKLGDKGDSESEHRVAIAKMHPAKLHQHMMDAAAGKHGPEAQRSAQQVMAPAESSPVAAPAGKSPFSGDNDADDQPQSTGGNPFSGGR
jgi:hypothetical protein